MISERDVNRACHLVARFVWEQYWNEEVPNKFHVHHIDGNWANNEISNLTACSIKRHRQIHRWRNNKNYVFTLKNPRALVESADWHKEQTSKRWRKEIVIQPNGWLYLYLLVNDREINASSVCEDEKELHPVWRRN